MSWPDERGVDVQLQVRRWGSGSRTAALVHGFSDDAETWWRVGPLLAERGFTVLAPELRGHGESPRAASYSLQEFAEDLVETLPQEADLVLGHSLGAMVLGLVAPRLNARRVVFVDPAWERPMADLAVERVLPTTPEQLPSNWSPEDVEVDLASNRRLDPAVAEALAGQLAAGDAVPVPPAVHPGTVVLVPELDPVLPAEAHEAVRAAGYEIRTQPGVRHVMHRDDLDGFMELLAAVVRDPVAVG